MLNNNSLNVKFKNTLFFTVKKLKIITFFFMNIKFYDFLEKYNNKINYTFILNKKIFHFSFALLFNLRCIS